MNNKVKDMIINRDKIINLIDDYLPHWELDKMSKIHVSLDYITQYNCHDLFAFVECCKHNKMQLDEADIAPTLAHDLTAISHWDKSGMKVPKTTGYYNNCKKLFPELF